MRTYTIKKDKHYSRIALPIPHCKVDKYNAMAIFNTACYYPISIVNNSGLNKLCGFTYGTVHKYSFRVAWEPNFLVANEIKLYAYSYVNGKRDICYLGVVKTNYAFDINITFENGRITYLVDDNKYVIPIIIEPKIGVYCFPHFGGIDGAPTTMKIDLEYQHFKP